MRADRWDLRSLGTTLSMAYVAGGRISAYVLFSSSAIHAGAGSLMVTEAGATLSDIDGRPWVLDSDSLVVAATPDLHRELIGLVRTSG
jgi:myo-inositol-1(or 4)-monophosphatase